jgi:hypothetical protein
MSPFIQRTKPAQPTLSLSPHTSGKLTLVYPVSSKLIISYLILIVVGHIRDFLDKKFYPSAFAHLVPSNVSLSCNVRNIQLTNRATPL